MSTCSIAAHPKRKGRWSVLLTTKRARRVLDSRPEAILWAERNLTAGTVVYVHRADGVVEHRFVVGGEAE